MSSSTAQGSWPKAHGLFPFALLLWFVFMTPWGTFPDPDAFYHAHIAKLMLDSGPLQAFPWLDLTTLGTQFADHHYFFHLILGPAIFFFGEFWGTQLMAPVLATITALALWGLVRRMNAPYAGMIVFLALLSPNFTQRLLLAKASPLAIGFFIVIIGAFLFRKPVLMFFAAMLFTLSHGGWILSVIVIGALSAGLMVYNAVFGEQPSAPRPTGRVMATCIALPWKTVLALPLGIAAGLLLHPNRKELLHFLWIQVVQVNIFSTGTVLNQGREWNPSAFGDIVQDAAPLMIAALVIGAGLLFAGKRLSASALSEPSRPQTNNSHRDHDNRMGAADNGRQSADDSLRTYIERAFLLALPVALTLAMTLNSRRYAEFFVPSLALWLASLSLLIDANRFRAWVQSLKRRTYTRMFVRMFPILIAALAAHHAFTAWKVLHAEYFRFDAFRTTMAAISNRAAPGDRVFQSNWDEFPMLWAADDRLKYLFGLDPAFLYAKHPELSKAQFELVTGQTSSTLWEVIVERTGSRFIFETPVRHPNFDQLLREDTRFREIARDAVSAAFEVVSEPKNPE